MPRRERGGKKDRMIKIHMHREHNFLLLLLQWKGMGAKQITVSELMKKNQLGKCGLQFYSLFLTFFIA